MLTEVFLSFLVSSTIGCILVITQYCLKSKCDEISFCGVKIHRRVELEQDIEIQTPTITPLERNRGISVDRRPNE